MNVSVAENKYYQEETSKTHKEPIIVVFGHQKGGTGKSTLCVTTAIGLIYHGFKVGIIDADMPQGTTHAFFKRRELTNLKCPNHLFCLTENETDSKKDSYKKDVIAFTQKMIDLKDMDFIIVDTAGSRTNFTKIAVSFADILFTPVNYSLIDIQMLFKIDRLTNQILPGNYSEIVWEQKKLRNLKGKKRALEWYILRNRLSPIYTKNSEDCLKILVMMADRIQYKIGPSILDRSIYRTSFNSECKTIFDTNDNDSSAINYSSTYNEMMEVVNICIDNFKAINNTEYTKQLFQI